MDGHNLFATRTTYNLLRLEYAVGLLVAVGYFFAHITDVRWVPALVLFAYIDLIGYIPGAIAYHRSPDGRISKGYYVAYNFMHSMATQGIVALAYVWIFGAEWALLVLPIHLFGDRAIFGNFLKPFAVAFEPQSHPAYVRLAAELASVPKQSRPPVSKAPAGKPKAKTA